MTRQLEPSYTHAMHSQACAAAAQERKVLVQHVLVKRGQLVYCGTIKAAYTVPDGPDCWTVETTWPEKTRLTVPTRNVIACNPLCCSCDLEIAGRRGPACGDTDLRSEG